jgi:cytosine/adenosine deaminase-related metal-dependent hydrolase
MEVLCRTLGDLRGATAVHCTHSDPADMELYAAAGGGVCLCPLTEANLGDGIADLPVMRRAGVLLSLGSDSNARISMLEEMRWLEYGQRLRTESRGVLADPRGDVARVALAAATAGGAAALGLPAGAIEPGLWADFALVDLDAPTLAGVPTDTLLEALLFGAAEEAIAGTCVGGEWLELS